MLKNRKGFTLTELIVTIAVSGVFFALIGSVIYSLLSSFRNAEIAAARDEEIKAAWVLIEKTVEESIFETSEKSILDSVIKNFGCHSGKTLEKFTHLEMPWRQTRVGLPMHTHSNRIIHKELIGKYFLAVKEKFNMLNPGDMEEYSKEIFNRIY